MFLSRTKSKKSIDYKLNNELQHLNGNGFQREITDKEYVVQFDDIQRRIRELEG